MCCQSESKVPWEGNVRTSCPPGFQYLRNVLKGLTTMGPKKHKRKVSGNAVKRSEVQWEMSNITDLKREPGGNGILEKLGLGSAGAHGDPWP